MNPSPTPQPGPDEPDLAAMLQRMLQEGVADPRIAAAMREMGVDPDDPRTLAAMGSQLGTFLDPATRPSNEQAARDAARAATASAGPDPAVSDADRAAVAEAVSVAQLWLDPVTSLGPVGTAPRALSRAEWVDQTMARWDELVEPVARGISEAIGAAMARQVEQLGTLTAEDAGPVELPPELANLPGATDFAALMGDPAGLADLVRRMGPLMSDLSSAFVAAQTGRAVGTLATDVVSGTEVGLPLLPDGAIALLPTNVASVAADLQLDVAEVRLYLAVREAARSRLFATVAWLGPALVNAVREYAENITIDTDAIEESLRDVDLGGLGSADFDTIREALEDRLFAPDPTPAQSWALTRLETLLALVEGWVDHVTERAVAPHLPHAPALGEAARRRRAGGPAQKAFSALVGLDLRPRRLRDAANLWAALSAAMDPADRDECWSHPDVAPGADDLEDPLGYVEKVRAHSRSDSLDAELADLLGGDAARGGEPGGTSGPGTPGPGTSGPGTPGPGTPGAGGDDAPGPAA